MTTSVKTTTSNDPQVLKNVNQVIDVLVLIDTDKLKEYYNSSTPQKKPSQDPKSPTDIDHSFEFMYCAGSRQPVQKQGTADLEFYAIPGDIVRFHGMSMYANSQDSVIVYDITPNSSARLFNHFDQIEVKIKGAAAPQIDDEGPGNYHGLPAQRVVGDFYAYSTTVKEGGDEAYKITFALYELDKNGENQLPFGYFRWDPTIHVS
ncbi:MAG TPA: inclusion body family protein [Chitinophaga sp.]|uniref:inclusion body family protein n=1 Tax=Chitinophaga sp. TaxID=1869181 RepID=UPI002BFBEE85|nr:inclusion body family protein [Chitinophaga sp.]HVI44241.1 inclusion body family protein [Chitinophaga sp.]